MVTRQERIHHSMLLLPTVITYQQNSAYRSIWKDAVLPGPSHFKVFKFSCPQLMPKLFRHVGIAGRKLLLKVVPGKQQSVFIIMHELHTWTLEKLERHGMGVNGKYATTLILTDLSSKAPIGEQGDHIQSTCTSPDCLGRNIHKTNPKNLQCLHHINRGVPCLPKHLTYASS